MCIRDRDSSDGLAWSLYELSDACNVGFIIDNVPIAKEAAEFAEMHNLDPLELSLYGGEEYELIVTIQPEFWEKVKMTIVESGGSLTKIGVVVEEKKIELQIDGEIRVIERRGWEHFKM